MYAQPATCSGAGGKAKQVPIVVIASSERCAGKHAASPAIRVVGRAVTGSVSVKINNQHRERVRGRGVRGRGEGEWELSRQREKRMYNR